MAKPNPQSDTAESDAAAAKAAAEKAKQEAAEAKAVAKAEAAAAKAAAKEAAAQEKIEAAATEGGIELSSVTGTGPDGAITLADVRKAIQVKKAEERANRPKKAPLTLSQRRAVLKLADGPITPANAFNATPLDYLVHVGLAESVTVTVPEPYTEKEDEEVEIPEAERKEGGPTTKTVKVAVEKTREVNRQQYSLTDLGVERARELNPKWKTWKPDHSGVAASDSEASVDTETPAEDAA